MPLHSHCPEPARLQALLAGRLDDEDPEYGELVRHLDRCESCQTALTRLADGGESFAGKARQLADENPRDSAILHDLVARFRSKLAEDTTPVEDDLRLNFLGPATRPGLLGTVAHYEVIEVLGQGGMGIVFKALDPALNRYVAVKVVAPHLAVVAAARKRFAREARAAAALSHENVVPIYAVDEHHGLPYLVMPLVVGESLQSRLDRLGPLDLTQILRIGMQTASGLAAAHAQGLIHRDIKPANILLENGVERVKITDFGLARTVDDASLTESGVLVGSPQYMAPEQARGESLDHRTDLFSLGGVMYAMCLGRSPFRAPTALAVLKRVCEDAPRPVREVNPDVPDWLAAIIDKLLEKTPEARYQTAAEVATLLEKRLAEHQLPTNTPAAMIGDSPPAPPRRHNRWATAAMIALAVLAALGWTEATAVTHVREAIATILRIKTSEGTLIIQVDDPAADVRIEADGKEIVIAGAGVHEVRLRPGPHQLKVKKDGKPAREELITITRGGKQVARIERDPVAVDPPSPTRYLSDPEPVERANVRTQAEMYRSDPRDIDQTEKNDSRRAPALKRVTEAEPANSAGSTVLPIDRPDSDDHEPRSTVPTPLFTLDAATGSGTAAVAYAPDGKTLAMASSTLISLWDLDLQSRLVSEANDSETKDPANAVSSLDFSRDGKYLAAGSLNGSVTVYDVSSPNAPKRVRRLTGKTRKDSVPFENSVWKVAFIPGRMGLLAAAYWDNAVREWDTNTGQQLGPDITHPGKVRTLAFTPDGNTIATGMGIEPSDNVLIRDNRVAGASVIGSLSGNVNGTVCMEFSPDGAILATGGADKLVRLWDVQHRTELARWSGHTRRVEAIKFSPDGRWLVSVGAHAGTPENSGEVRIWDIGGGNHAVQSIVPASGLLTGLSFSPRGTTFATCGGDGTVKVWAFDPKPPIERRTPVSLWPRMAIRPKAGEAVTALATSPDGMLLAAGTRGAVHLYKSVAPASVIELRDAWRDVDGLGSWPMKLTFSPSGKRVASLWANGFTNVWDTQVVKELAQLERHAVTTFPLVFADDTRLLLTDRDTFIKTWAFFTGEAWTFMSQCRAGGMDVSSPNGKLLALYGEGAPSGTVTILNAETHELVGTLTQAGTSVEVTCLRFVPGTKTLVVGYRRPVEDRTIARNGQDAPPDASERFCLKIWDCATDVPRDTIGWNGPILDLAISPNGNHLAVVGGHPGERDPDTNRAVLISHWDSGRPGGERTVRVLEGHGDLVRSVAFFDGGRQVVTACDDGLVRFWTVPEAK